MTVSIDLSWTDNATTEDNYIVERREVEKVAVLPGADGDYFSTPAIAALAGSATPVLVWRGALDSIATGSFQDLIAQWKADTPDRGILLRYNSDGRLQVYYSDDGSSLGWCQWDLSLTISPNQKVGLRVDKISTTQATLFIDYGDGNWNSFGTESLTEAVGNLYSSVSDIVVGNRGNGQSGNGATGSFERAKIYSDSYNGTLVAEFNPSHAPGYGTAQSWDSVNTGETWTGQGNASIDAVNTLVYDTFTGDDGTLLTARSADIDVVGDGWAMAGSDGQFEIQSNKAQLVGRTAGMEIGFLDTGSGDSLASVDLSDWVSATASLVLRAPSLTDDSLWHARIGANVLTIQERTGGSNIPRGSVAITTENTTINFSAEGSVLTAWTAEGSVSYTSSLYQSQTFAGLRTNVNLISYDNFKVTTIAAADNGAGWEVLTDTLPADTEVYEDFTALSGKRYAYRTACKNATGQSGYSNVIEVNT